MTLPKSRGGLIHLGEKSQAYHYSEAPYWETKVYRKDLKIGDRVFICTEGYVRGFFILEDLYWDMISKPTRKQIKDHDLYFIYNFIADSWTPIFHIPMIGFQGVHYRKFKFIELYVFLNYHPEDHEENWDYIFGPTFYPDGWLMFEIIDERFNDQL